MTISEVLSNLVAWTPFLLEGFGWNILIAILAALIGTSIGGVLAWLRLSSSKSVANASLHISTLFYKLPTLALLFYIAILLPNEVQIPTTNLVYPFPNWIKAALALSAAQVGFTSHNLMDAIGFWRKREHGAALLFIPNWGSNLLITVIASSSASLVGVSELVSRCNKVVNATDSFDLIIPIYFYACLLFLAFCYPLTLAMKKLKQVMIARFVGRVHTESGISQGVVE
jgi:polar amino acid transport system permease protein